MYILFLLIMTCDNIFLYIYWEHCWWRISQQAVQSLCFTHHHSQLLTIKDWQSAELGWAVHTWQCEENMRKLRAHTLWQSPVSYFYSNVMLCEFTRCFAMHQKISKIILCHKWQRHITEKTILKRNRMNLDGFETGALDYLPERLSVHSSIKSRLKVNILTCSRVLHNHNVTNLTSQLMR